MEILREILLFLHLLGMALIIGGYFANVRAPRVIPGMLHAAYLQVITGLALVAVLEMTPHVEVNHMKIGIKVVLAILVTVFAFLGNRKEKKQGGAEAPAGTAGTTATAVAVRPSATMAHLTFGAAVLAVLVAVFV